MRCLTVSVMAVFAALVGCGGGSKDDAGPGNLGGGVTVPGGSSGGGGGSDSDNTTDIRLRYPSTSSQSPITDDVVDILSSIVDNGSGRRANMFMKVGDAASSSSSNLSCFASSTSNDLKLDGRTELQDTITYFKSASYTSTSPCIEAWCSTATTSYNRQSYATADGATASSPLEGDPTALDEEDSAINPQLAIVQLGTNDGATILSNDDIESFVAFYSSLAADADALIDTGIVPILVTVPPRATDEDSGTYRNVPTLNALVRLLAQSRGVPLVDLYRDLIGLSDYGLSDGVNLSVYATASTTVAGCDFTSDGLTGGHNVRNLLQITALARVHDVLTGGDAPDSDAGSLSGSGTEDAPYVIDTLPFADSVADADASTSYYRLSTTSEQPFRIIAVDPNNGDALAFVVRDDSSQRLSATGIGQVELDAGDYTIRVSGSAYGLAVIALDAEDPTL